MRPRFSILIPFRTDGGIRQQVLDWNVARFRHYFPDAEICIGTDSGEGPLNRSRMRNDAARQATTDILFFSDSDVTYRVDTILHALALLGQGRGMVKLRRVHWVSEEGTRRLLGTRPDRALTLQSDEITHTRRSLVGMFFLLTRADFEKAGGWDERFVGWGEEDIAFNLAVETLCGKTRWLQEHAIHFWHPRGGENNKQSATFLANKALMKRYEAAAAAGSQALRALIEE